MSIRGHRGCAVLFGLVLPAFSSGCGYSTQRPFRDDIQTISIEMMHSREFRRELEFQLTESLAKRIEAETPYKVASRDRADSVITGEILEVQQRTFGTDFETDLPRETGVTIIIRWQWKDLRSGEILRNQPRFLYTSSYIPPVGESFETGALRGLDGLARRIVETMENPW